MGPNVRRLFAKFIARESIPPDGGIDDGIKFFVDEDHRHKVWKQAEKKMFDAFRLVKFAPDNPYGDDDEKIAGAILDRIEKRDLWPPPPN